ncbi:MAG: Ig-like domain-containing protein, partial [Lachnospiraceae bacterium]|nr:Ig-like domain-containing protein [Lachnospiraceae bacterium]
MMKKPCYKVFRMWGILLLAIFAVLSFHMPVRAASAKVLNTSVYTIKVGTTQTFGGTGYTSGKSSNSSVISVKTTKTKETDSWGGVYYECTCKIKAKKTGKATVTLTLQGGYVEKMYFLVTDSDSFEYDTTAIALKKGKSETVKAAAPSGCTVKYSSSKKSVATVNSKGKITAKKKGKAVISAKVYYKGKRIKTMTKTVFVTNSSPYSYDTSSLSLTTGESKTVKATAPGGCTVKYSSSNSSIAKVDSKGKITAVNSGTATVSVKVYYDGDIIKTMKKEVTVSSGCSYELYRVGVSDTYSNCSSCFYLKTEYDDIYSIEIKNNNSYGFVAVLYSEYSAVMVPRMRYFRTGHP